MLDTYAYKLDDIIANVKCIVSFCRGEISVRAAYFVIIRDRELMR